MRAFAFIAFIAFVAVLGADPAAARVSTGRLFVQILKDTEIPSSDLVVYWRVDTLLGEPVVRCAGTWVVSPDSLSSFRGQLFGRPPREVLESVRLYDVVVRATVTLPDGSFMWLDKVRKTTAEFECDLGAMGAPFVGAMSDYERLPEAERLQRLSFNVPGSPAWASLFVNLDEASAKETVKKGFKLWHDHFFGDPFRPRVVKASYSHAGIEAWVAEQEAEKLRKAREAVEAEVRRRQERIGASTSRAKDAAKGKPKTLPVPASSDPWSQPTKSGTVSTESTWDQPSKALTVDEQERVNGLQQREAAQRTLVREKASAAASLQGRGARTGDNAQEVCARHAAAIAQCVRSRCGDEPAEQYSGPGIWFQTMTICPNGPAGEECRAEKAYKASPEGRAEIARLAEERRQRELREAEALQQQIANYRSCVSSNRPLCPPAGFTTVETCRAEVQRAIDAPW